MSSHGIAFGIIHPALALAGVGAAAIPLLIHLWNRHHPPRVRWAAMAFLRSAHRNDMRRRRIDQLLLLLLRSLAVALVGLAASRPYVGHGGLFGEAPRHHILLIDNSYSMGQRVSESETALERARLVARRWIERANRRDRLTLITCAQPPEVIGETGDGRGMAGGTGDGESGVSTLAHLQAIRLAGTSAEIGEALRLATTMGSDVAPGHRMITLLSDLQDVPEAHGAPSARGEAGTSLPLRIGVIRAATENNAAITGFKSADRVVTAHWPATFRARIANHSDREWVSPMVHVSIDGQRAHDVTVDRVAARSEEPLLFELSFAQPGQHRVTAGIARMEGDVMPVDDEQSLAVEVTDRVAVLVVTDAADGESAARRTRFITAALSPESRELQDPAQRPLEQGGSGNTLPPDIRRRGEAAQSPFAVRALFSGELINEPLDPYEWIVLLDVASLDAEQWRRIRGFVARGGGLLILPGPRINIERYNAYQVAGGEGPVPVKLAGFADIGRGPASERYLQFRPEASRHPAMSELTGHPESGFYSTRIFQFLKVAPDDRGAGVTVLLRFDDGSPALLERAIGEGRVLMMTTALNMEWCNLPARGDVVSFLIGLGQYLSKDRNTIRRLAADQAVRVALGADDIARNEPPVIVEPDGRSAVMAVKAVGAISAEAVHDRAPAAGFYEVQVNGNVPRRELLCKQADPGESNLARMSQERIRALFGNHATLSDVTAADFDVSDEVPVRELSTSLLVMAGIILLAECGVASRRRGARASR